MAVEFEIDHLFPGIPDEVFAAHTDVDKFHEWMPGCESIERLDEGFVKEGSAWRETRLMDKRSATEEFIIQRYDAPQEWTLYVDGSKGSTGRGEYIFEYRFEEAEQGTLVHLKGKVDMGFFMNLLAQKRIHQELY